MTRPKLAQDPQTATSPEQHHERRLAHLEAKIAEKSTDRTEAFSDGVFAIAITLLVLEIVVPRVAGGDGERHLPKDLLQALAHEWPSYLSYVLTFVMLGSTWINHHIMFNYVVRVDRMILAFNTLLLLVIALNPFPAALLAQGIADRNNLEADPHSLAIASIIFSSVQIMGGVFYNATWLYAVRRGLIAKEADPKQVKQLTRISLIYPLIFVISIGLAFVSPEASLLIYVLVPLAYVLPNSTDRF